MARDLFGKRHLALRDKIKKMYVSFGSNLFRPKEGRDQARWRIAAGRWGPELCVRETGGQREQILDHRQS